MTAGDRGAVPYDLVYAFDDINRLTARTDKLAAAGGVATFTYPTNGQRPHAVAEVSATTGGTSTVDSYGYNAYGAMENRDGQGLEWDGQQRLTHYEYNNEDEDVEDYEYWTSNQRVQRQAGGTRTVYLPGLDITIQGANRTITKQITIDGAVVATKVIGAQVAVWWNCADMQNSTTCQTLPGNTGTTQKHDYLPYGATRGTNTITTTNRGFLNQPEDTTGLTYLNNRYHDPQLAAFVSVDPLVSKTGTPYLYGNGTPVTLSDPSGLDPDTNAQIRDRVRKEAQARAIPSGRSLPRNWVWDGAASGDLESYAFRAGQQFGVDPAIIMTIIRKESDGQSWMETVGNDFFDLPGADSRGITNVSFEVFEKYFTENEEALAAYWDESELETHAYGRDRAIEILWANLYDHDGLSIAITALYMRDLIETWEASSVASTSGSGITPTEAAILNYQFTEDTVTNHLNGSDPSPKLATTVTAIRDIYWQSVTSVCGRDVCTHPTMGPVLWPSTTGSEGQIA